MKKIMLSLFVLLFLCKSSFTSVNTLSGYISHLNELYATMETAKIEFSFKKSVHIPPPMNKVVRNLGTRTVLYSNPNLRIEEHSCAGSKTFKELLLQFSSGKYSSTLTMLTPEERYEKLLDDRGYGTLQKIVRKNNDLGDPFTPITILKYVYESIHERPSEYNPPVLIEENSNINMYEMRWRDDSHQDPQFPKLYYMRIATEQSFTEPMFRKYETGYFNEVLKVWRVAHLLEVVPDSSSPLGYQSYVDKHFEIDETGKQIEKIYSEVNIQQAQTGVRVFPEDFRFLLKKGSKYIERHPESAENDTPVKINEETVIEAK